MHNVNVMADVSRWKCKIVILINSPCQNTTEVIISDHEIRSR